MTVWDRLECDLLRAFYYRPGEGFRNINFSRYALLKSLFIFFGAACLPIGIAKSKAQRKNFGEFEKWLRYDHKKITFSTISPPFRFFRRCRATTAAL
jgi:hypothetical protein